MSKIKIHGDSKVTGIKVNRVDHFYHDLWMQYIDWCLGKSVVKIPKAQIPRFEGYAEYRLNGGI